ncbi:NAD-dependent DNA ligase LigA [Mediterraneibacter hominis]|uniref:NAD-dependent DNA ligase LigA n=1 Tax=Mediterraneibacter hominis TaxID=2763054 RepID=UPI001FAD3C2B|nr:NAD-dependent DNA ligase LigA [Mediterraneibacter hominis]
MNARDKLQEITNKLNYYRYEYYNNSNSVISDKEYDDLYDELLALENKLGISYVNSPTKTVGYEAVSKLEKVKHSHPMLSLNKTKNIDDLLAFMGENDCVLMHKLDGLTVLLTYDKGELIQAETRGDGETGEIITHNARVFTNIPLQIPYKHRLEIEGEAIITYDDFEKINSELTENEKYKNPRNLVSGSVRQLDSNIAAKRHIKFVAWKVPYIENEAELVSLCGANDLVTYYRNHFMARLNTTSILGFDTVSALQLKMSTKDSIEKRIEILKRMAQITHTPIDGLVITYDDIEYGLSLGSTGHHPKHSLAFKFYEEEEETIIRGFDWTMGKTGTLTPTAIFDSVEFCGTKVSRASLHNVSILKNLQIGVGDRVTVYKSNEIIPQIRDNITKSNSYEIPVSCPICGSKTEVIKEKDSEALKCTNPYCKGKLLGRVSHFVSRKGMDIDGLSDETLSKFIELGWVKNLSDIYELTCHFQELISMEGFGTKSVAKLSKAIEKSKNVALSKFICALSIPGIGSSQSKELTKVFKTWDNLNMQDLIILTFQVLMVSEKYLVRISIIGL